MTTQRNASGRPFALGGLDYNNYPDGSGDTFAAALGHYISRKFHNFSGVDAILYDGDIFHACSSACLQAELDRLDYSQLIAIWHSIRPDRAGTHYGELPALVADEADDNLHCDECHEQIGTHFAECVLCSAEVTAEPDEPRLIWGWNGSGHDVSICDDCARGRDDDGADPDDPSFLDYIENADERDAERARLADQVARVTAAVALHNAHGDYESWIALMTDDATWHYTRGAMADRAAADAGQLQMAGMARELPDAVAESCAWPTIERVLFAA